MKSILKSIAAGLLIGAFFFFVPFHFPILLFLILFFVFARRRRGWKRGYGWHHGFEQFTGTIPIDGSDSFGRSRKGQPEQSINIQ